LRSGARKVHGAKKSLNDTLLIGLSPGDPRQAFASIAVVGPNGHFRQFLCNTGWSGFLHFMGVIPSLFST
jgi:hypothetical protein